MKTSHRIYSLLAAAAAAIGVNADAPPVIVSTVVDSFKWKDPFGSHASPPGFRATCEATKTFKATQHSLHDLQAPPPLGLAPWADAIKFFFGGRPFPGSWDGVDNQGMERDVIMMEYADVPATVKDWIEEQKKDVEGDNRYLFGVYRKPASEGIAIKAQAGRNDGEDKDKIILFAAGAIYDTLPLWVAEGSGCQAELSNLSKYHADAVDKGIVAWVPERSEPNRAGGDPAITFKIKAQVVEMDPEKSATSEKPIGVASENPASSEIPSNKAEKVVKDEL